MLKKSFLALVVVLILIPSALALDFKTSFDITNNKILLSGVAVFNVTIENTGEGTEKFEVYSLTYPTWDVKIGDGTKIFKISPNGTKTFEVLVSPLHVDKVGAYVVPVNVRMERTQEVSSVPLKIEIRTENQLIGRYIPTVLLSYRVEEQVDPREPISMQVTLDNQNSLDLGEIIIKIDSKTIKDEIKAELGPKESKTIEAVLEIDPMTPPQEDSLSVTVLKDGSIIEGPKLKKVSIIGISDISEKEIQERSFLKVVKRITFLNQGNKAYEGLLKVESNLINTFFISTAPQSKLLKQNDSRYYTWETKVLPLESFEVVLVEDYRPLCLILLTVIIFLLLYLRFRSPLVVRKTVSDISKKEGGISEIKIMLNIRNRGKKYLENLLVVDPIPDIAMMEKGIIGTLPPTKVVRRHNKGSLVKWDIEGLGINEERVISYRVKSKLSIIGDFNLEPAVAKCSYGKKAIVVKSNDINISS